MSLLIVTSRYLKSGTAKTKSQRKNYTKYIATRESVEVREQSKKYSTENQKKLLNELLNDFPESKKYSFLELKDFNNFYSILEPILSNYIASEVQNIDTLDIKNFNIEKIISDTFNGISLSTVHNIVKKTEITTISKENLELIFNNYVN